MWGFFFEQKQTERVAGNRSPGCLSCFPRSGRIWLRETLGPHIPVCPATRLSAFLSLSSLPSLRLTQSLVRKNWQSFGEGKGRCLARCGNWLAA